MKMGEEGNIKKLSVSDFRNIRIAILEFSPHQNVFVGQNAEGKTNLLEAIYLVSTGRSFRTTRLDDFYPWSGGGPRLKGRFGGDITVEIDLSSPLKKLIRVNEVEKARLGDLLGLIQIIEILPQDICLIEGEPSRRRRFLDLGISQWDARYYEHYLKYAQALKQRNRSLQQGFDLERDKIRVWNKILEENGAYLVWQRRRVTQALNIEMGKIYPGFVDTLERAEINYRTSLEGETLEDLKSNFCERLLRAETRDIAIGFSTVGPHRDDLEFKVEDKEIRSFGSEGQKRSLVIAIKLAWGATLREKEGKTPVFILDDVLAQLDEGRAKGLMKTLYPYQSFLSVTSLDFHRCMIPQGKWFKVKNGEYQEFSA